MGKHYTVSDGKLVLTLEEAEEGGYVVTSPLDPELVTEAETVSEAFEMARDALEGLTEARRNLIKDLLLQERVSLLGKLPQAERKRLLRTFPDGERKELLRALSPPERVNSASKRARASRRKSRGKAGRVRKGAGDKA